MRFNRRFELRVTVEDFDRVEKLHGKIMGVTRAALVRRALRLGVERLEQDPTLLVQLKDEEVKR